MAFRKSLAMLLVFAYLLLVFLPPLSSSTEDPVRNRYEEWITKHGRQYKSSDEKELRFQVYKTNYQMIQTHNAEDNTYKLSDNIFADMTNEEFRKAYLGFGNQIKTRHEDEQTAYLGSNRNDSPQEAIEQLNLPDQVDWRTAGAVTPVEDQGQCGSCWAFSAVAAIEGINQIKNGKLVSLSKQELLDCDTDYDQGCGGGYMSNAFEFVIKNKGLSSESDYPYVADQNSCVTAKLPDHIASITAYMNVTSNSETGLLQAVAAQPVSVAIDASGMRFQFYSSGIFTGPCNDDLNHGVTAVGYGTEGGNKYWIVKNSWGTSWGENGYIRMKRGAGDREGLCGINMLASYPII